MLKIRSTLIAAVTALLTVTLGISQTAQAQTYNELRKTNWVENCQENGRLEIDWDDRNKISYKWKAVAISWSSPCSGCIHDRKFWENAAVVVEAWFMCSWLRLGILTVCHAHGSLA